MKTSDLFVQCLENEGVEYIFGLPGEENIDLLESLRKSDKIEFILTRHEQGAGFMAATYGRLTGRPGVCLSTLGPGATNMVTPTAYANLGAMPMLVITGQKPIKESKQGRFQILDIVEMMEPLTKSTRQVSHARHVPSIIRESFRIAQEERPGAVHIELPEDIAKEDVNEQTPYPVVPSEEPHSSKLSIDRAAAMIRDSERPLLLIGAGSNRSSCRKALTSFVDKTAIPFFSTQMGKGVIDERHQLCLGTAALSADDFIHEAIDRSDLIINVGHDTIEKPPFFMSSDDDRKVIHINYLPAELDAVYFPQLNVIGDISDSMERLTKALNKEDSHWNINEAMRVKEHVESRLAKYEKDDRFPILPQRLVKISRALLEEDGMIALDNGIYKIWYTRNYKSYIQNGLLVDNALATMGAGLPSAMMTKMLYPERQVISVNGDGGFMMNAQEIETAVRLDLDLVIIVLNDSAYGMIRWKQEDEGFADYGLTYTNPDIVKFAESFGAKGYRPNSVDQFIEILTKCLVSSGVHVIDLPIDYSLNHEILNVRIKEYTDSINDRS